MITKHFSIWTKRMILDRDNHTCIYCGKPASGVDHVIPLSKGGRSISANGVACCISCNKIKYNHFLPSYTNRGIAKLIQHGEDVSWIKQLPLGSEYQMKYGDGIFIGLIQEGLTVEGAESVMLMLEQG